MRMLLWATPGLGLVVAAWVTLAALCVAAKRGDAQAVADVLMAGYEDDYTAADDAALPDRPERRFSRPGDRTAAAARAALDARAAWVFTNPAAYARLQVRGRDGEALPEGAEALALRVAGLAINGDVPVIVPTAASGALGAAALVGVAIPFYDGRLGALVVAGDAVRTARPAATHALQELAIEHAELGAYLGTSRGRARPRAGVKQPF